MSESPNKRPVVVGIFVLIGLIFFIAGVLMIGNISGTFNKRMQVVTFFDDVNGLQVGNNVWFSGVKIGNVKNLRFYGDSQVEVLVNIDISAQEYIRKDARIKISADGFIGNKILVISGGTQKVGRVEQGDTIQVESTFSSEDMLNTLQENNMNLLGITKALKGISTGIAAGEGSIGKMLSETTLYDNLNNAVVSLNNTSAKAMQMVNSLNTFTANLNKSGTLVNDVMTDTVVFDAMRQSIVQLQQMADSANTFVAQMNAASRNTDSAMGAILYDEQTGTDVKNLIQNIESSTAKLDEDLEALQHNFLFRRYFKKKAKEEKKAASNL